MENDRPQRFAQPHVATTARPWRTVMVLCMAQFVGVLNFQIVSIALPAIQHGLGFSQEQLQWVVSANALAFGGFLLLAGRASDLFGHRRLFIIGMALFAVASLGCGLIPSQAGLIVARAIQGLGTAMATPAALALLTDTFAEGVKRNRAFGIWGAVGPLGGVVSVLLGGVLASGPGWPWVFFLSVPIALLALVLAPVLLGEQHNDAETSRLDIPGALTATSGIALLVYGLSQAEQFGMHTFWTIGLLVLALALLLTFGFIETHIAHPLVPLHIFRRRTLTGANLVTVAFAAAGNTPIFFFALYMQQIRGFSPVVTGLAFLPTNLTMITGAALGTRLVNWLGARRTMVAGMGMLLTALLLLARLAVDSSYLSSLLPGLVLLGGGLGLTQVATTVTGTQHISTTQRGLASGLLNVSVQVGTALGLAFLVTIATAHTGTLVRAGQPGVPALVAGYQWAFYTGAGLALVGAITALLLLRPQPLNPDQE